MNATQDPRDTAILTLRNALINSRQSTPLNTEQIDAALQQTEQIARDAAARVQSNMPQASYNLLDLEGVGAEMWRDELAGMDAQEYVNNIRTEWDGREQE
jgi:hypothetical protein